MPANVLTARCDPDTLKTAVLASFPPRGYGYLVDYAISYRVSHLTGDPSPTR